MAMATIPFPHLPGSKLSANIMKKGKASLGWLQLCGRSAANHRICLCAIQGALRNDDRNDVVVVHWADPPDTSIPQEFHAGLPTVADWLAIPGAR
jgi:hypothetical protein